MTIYLNCNYSAHPWYLHISVSNKQLFQKSATINTAKTMYVCIEVALCGDAHGLGIPTGPGGGTHLARGSNIPTCGIIGTSSLTLDHTYALMCAF